ncbi:MAG: hypothetical protein KIS91_05580 [Anaerolineae bacterium]|nr:hypothetical protein [Anaerolineae bacterium]
MPSSHFFLTDIYADRDFARRDAELEALYDFVRPVMPTEAIESMANAVALNNLTHELDGHMVQRLQALGATDDFTDAQYAAAYHRCEARTSPRSTSSSPSCARSLACKTSPSLAQP